MWCKFDYNILQEHWLWPFDHTSLNQIHPDFNFIAVSNNRLNETSDLSHRGCDGVAILYNKHLRVMDLTLNCDRLCGISVQLHNSTQRQDRSLFI